MDCAFNLDFEKKQGEENAYLRLKGTVKMKDVGLEDEIGKAYQIIDVKEIDANLKEFAFFRKILTSAKSNSITRLLSSSETATV